MKAFTNKSTNGFDYNIVNRMKSDHSESQSNFPLSLFKESDPINSDYNKIRFWSEVTDESCKELIESCKEVEYKLQNLGLTYDIAHENLPSIEIYINSPGGSVHSALAVVDHIQSSKFKYTSIVEGCAASAATLISTVCDSRKITSNGMMLIHELSSGCHGKMFEMDDNIHSLRKLMEVIYTIYRENTKVSKTDLKSILKHDIFWTADEALEFGIVDVIINRVKRPRYEDHDSTFKISDKELKAGALKLKKNLEKQSQSNNTGNGLMDLLNVVTTGNDDEDDDEDDEEEDEIPQKKRKVAAPQKSKKSKR